MSRTTVVRDEEVQPVTRGRNQEQLTGPLPSVGGGGLTVTAERCVYLSGGWFWTKVSRQSGLMQMWLALLLAGTTVLRDAF